jgi:hypothetical protein
MSDYNLILNILNKNPEIAYYILGAFITDGTVGFKTKTKGKATGIKFLCHEKIF